jgi:hypothetical protein
MRYNNNNNILYRDKLEANTHLLGLTVSPTLNGFLNPIDLHFFLFVRNSLHASIITAVDGFEDVKTLFEMAIGAERPVHLLLCGPPSSGKLLFMSSLTRLERCYFAVGSSSKSLEYLIICLSRGRVILSLMNWKK